LMMPNDSGHNVPAFWILNAKTVHTAVERALRAAASLAYSR